MINKQTTLDLNGPIISFTRNPSSNIICSSGISTFIGIATATFPSQTPASNTGYISYQWYDSNGPLSDGQIVSGSGTTTLTLYNNTSTKNVYLKADYVASAYGTDPITVGTARSTPNAINDPVYSGIASLLIKPDIVIYSQPVNDIQTKSSTGTFTVGAGLSFSGDTFTTGALNYQWQLNNVDLVDGSNSSVPNLPQAATISVTDDLGNIFTINFSQLSTFSNFVTGREYTLVPNTNITTKIRAVGGHGGTERYRFTRGGRGGVAEGTFTFLAQNTYKLIIGGGGGKDRRQGGYGGGGDSSPGGTGTLGGSGGGYTGLFRTSISQSNAILIAGGGGGAANEAEQGGDGGGLVGGHGQTGVKGGTQTSGGIGDNHEPSQPAGENGSALLGGNGVAGGGGGYFGGAGGGGGIGCCDDYAGGGGSGYLHPQLITNGSFDVANFQAREDDGSFEITLINASTSSLFRVSGSNTSTLKISCSDVGLSLIRCKITNSNACKQTVFSDTAVFQVVEKRDIINCELIPEAGGSATLYTKDLLNQGSYTITSNEIPSGNVLCFYSPEKDLDVYIKMYGSAGQPYGTNSGGQGGVSTLQLKLKANTEYIIPSLSSTKDGSAVWLYEAGKLLACAGGGGYGGASSSSGGAGGGVNVKGADGSGYRNGVGGPLVSIGQLTTTGIFGSGVTNYPIVLKSGDSIAQGRNGGQAISCPKGDYWINQGYSPCQNVGTTKFYTSTGQVVENTASIRRGFKSGYNIIETAGAGQSGGGKGGSGATGGSGGGNLSSGGGGSGYTDGTATIISTQQGGNTGTSKIIIELVTNTNDFYSGNYYVDSVGRVLILSAATVGKDPRTLTKITGKVLQGTDTCIDDTRWQYIINLARDENYRLTATLNNSSSAVSKATDFNIKRMINANYIPLKTSLTDWQLVPYSYPLYALAWDENDISSLGVGVDYSILSWGSTTYYYGYYGQSSNPFFTPTTYSNLTANWWLLPPGVPDFA